MRKLSFGDRGVEKLKPSRIEITRKFCVRQKRIVPTARLSFFMKGLMLCIYPYKAYRQEANQ